MLGVLTTTFKEQLNRELPPYRLESIVGYRKLSRKNSQPGPTCPWLHSRSKGTNRSSQQPGHQWLSNPGVISLPSHERLLSDKIGNDNKHSNCQANDEYNSNPL